VDYAGKNVNLNADRQLQMDLFMFRFFVYPETEHFKMYVRRDVQYIYEGCAVIFTQG
jgi:hypothetical protein